MPEAPVIVWNVIDKNEDQAGKRRLFRWDGIVFGANTVIAPRSVNRE
jgi:hypothetical protein